MLLVNTFLNYSSKNGLGLFANQNIPKDSIYWKRDSEFDLIITPKMLINFNEITQQFIEKYGFLEHTGNWYLCSDNAKYTNHSYNPNTLDIFNESGLIIESRAALNINTGDEISCDYTKICLTCLNGVNF